MLTNLQFLELLYELRTLPTTIIYEDDRTVATMKLMAYLKQAERRLVIHLVSNQTVTNTLLQRYIREVCPQVVEAASVFQQLHRGWTYFASAC